MGSGVGDISAFQNERAGMVLVGPWMVNSYIREGKNLGTAVMPTFGNVPATWDQYPLPGADACKTATRITSMA